MPQYIFRTESGSYRVSRYDHQEGLEVIGTYRTLERALKERERVEKKKKNKNAPQALSKKRKNQRIPKSRKKKKQRESMGTETVLNREISSTFMQQDLINGRKKKTTVIKKRIKVKLKKTNDEKHMRNR